MSYESKFDIAVYKAGQNKDAVIQAVQDLTGWNLQRSTTFVNDLTGFILEAVNYDQAAEAILVLEGAGAEAGMHRVVVLD